MSDLERELDALMYGISHDLRAPLRAIDGFSRVLEEDYAAALGEGRDVVAAIRANADRMKRMLEGLLVMSRESRRPLQPEDVDVQALVLSCEAETRARWRDRDVVVEVGELPACRGDVALLRQVWGALLDNAWKFSATRLEIGARDGAYYVRDDGTGYDPRQAHRLFGVFQRLHGTAFPGEGVGLALANRLVARHGGRMWAESEGVGTGATFWFAVGCGEKSI